LFEAGGKPLEAVCQSQKLLPATRLEAELVGYPPERLGDAAEIRDPVLGRALVHRSTAGCSLLLTLCNPWHPHMRVCRWTRPGGPLHFKASGGVTKTCQSPGNRRRQPRHNRNTRRSGPARNRAGPRWLGSPLLLL